MRPRVAWAHVLCPCRSGASFESTLALYPEKMQFFILVLCLGLCNITFTRRPREDSVLDRRHILCGGVWKKAEEQYRSTKALGVSHRGVRLDAPGLLMYLWLLEREKKTRKSTSRFLYTTPSVLFFPRANTSLRKSNPPLLQQSLRLKCYLISVSQQRLMFIDFTWRRWTSIKFPFSSVLARRRGLEHGEVDELRRVFFSPVREETSSECICHWSAIPPRRRNEHVRDKYTNRKKKETRTIKPSVSSFILS